MWLVAQHEEDAPIVRLRLSSLRKRQERAVCWEQHGDAKRWEARQPAEVDALRPWRRGHRPSHRDGVDRL